jgi:hypothetical protein
MKYEKWDLPARIALFVDALAYVKGFMQAKVGSFSRDLTLASGTQAITGVGFRPKCVVFFGAVDQGNRTSWGIDDGTNAFVVSNNSGASAGTFRESTAGSQWYNVDSANYQVGVIQSMDADGFTLNWTKTGSPAAGTATIGFLALGG